jgi:hypothetical protein
MRSPTGGRHSEHLPVVGFRERPAGGRSNVMPKAEARDCYKPPTDQGDSGAELLNWTDKMWIYQWINEGKRQVLAGSEQIGHFRFGRRSNGLQGSQTRKAST